MSSTIRLRPAICFQGVAAALFLTAFPICPTAQARVTLNALFSDHMVLQRDRPIPVWGTAAAGERVSVTFHSATVETTAAADGKWIVQLPPQKVATTPATLEVKGSNALRISDVLVGDVWLGSGQSNMKFAVSSSDGRERITKTPADKFQHLRLFNVDQKAADEPLSSVHGKWTLATTDQVLPFSAVLFFFGEALSSHLPNVPLGLIESSVGATNAYCWVPNAVRDREPGLAAAREWYAAALQDLTPDKLAKYQQAKQDYARKVAEGKSAHQLLPPGIVPPTPPMGPTNANRPSALYNGMIAPLAPFALRGIIWYQGEWDGEPLWASHYEATLRALATSWRAEWIKAAPGINLGAVIPFYIVQLPALSQQGDLWPIIREAQSQVSRQIPRSGLVVTFDIGPGLIRHPVEKTEVGKRVAALALADEYQQGNPGHGPVFLSAAAGDGKIMLTFDPGAPGLESSDHQPLRNFSIAGGDGKFVPATAEIDGKTIVVSAPGMSHPLSVRYADVPNPIPVNFYNTAGLPAGPFHAEAR